MISRIEGELVLVGGGRAGVKCGFLTYELLLPAADEQRLAGMIGETVTFLTLHYMEGHGQGASFVPRLIGFSSDEDRAFFELFTTVKGMGNRKALRALALPFPSVAAAIADRDLDRLLALPEIGKRTAETIIAALHGKVDRFVELKPITHLPAAAPTASTLMREAAAMLVQLGEPTLRAHQLVERTLAAEPAIDRPEELVAAAYRLDEPGPR